MTTTRGLTAFWRRRSLRFWLGSGMAIAILPLAVSWLAGYLLYRTHVVEPLVEDAALQREILRPLERIQLSLWDLSVSINDYVVDGAQRHRDELAREEIEIAEALEILAAAVAVHDLDPAPIDRARADWQEVDALARDLLTKPMGLDDAALVEEVMTFEQRIDDLAIDLELLFEEAEDRAEADIAEALATLALSERIAIAGFLVSLGCVALGVIVINRSLVRSMEELSDAAMRLAAGDRSHQVEIQIPPELVSVAAAFNTMTGQIIEQERALALQAQTDGLTGLFNRREFDRMLADEITRAARYGTPVSLIMLDLDHFKVFNDRHGHPAGDEALRTVGAALAESARETDRACRFGGEEFAVILPATDAEAALVLAERLRAAIAGRSVALDNGGTDRITASLGVATITDAAGGADALLADADAALYRSKQLGRDRVTAATP